jgi:hypothetical protein
MHKAWQCGGQAMYEKVRTIYVLLYMDKSFPCKMKSRKFLGNFSQKLNHKSVLAVFKKTNNTTGLY